VTAVDAPPGVAFAGEAAGEFVARPRARKLARRVFLWVVFAGVLTLFLASRRIYTPMIEFVLVAPLMCMSVAAVGYAVRRARVRIDVDGVRWGWDIGGFRMRPERMKGVKAYRDAIALQPKRGSTWYLSHYDWDRFERVASALREAKIPYERIDRRAPIGARLQSYGVVLDFLLVLNALVATLALVAAVLI
jgi:hypothetical protein